MAGLFDLTGKVAVITGGSSGIGLGFARGIARQGGDVAIWARSREKLEAAKAELSAFGGRVIARQVDVASEEQVCAAFDDLLGEWGRLDLVFANAGVLPPGLPVVDTPLSVYRDFLSISMDGAFFTLREGGRRMRERAQAGRSNGSLVFCASLSIHLGQTGVGVYAAAKAGITAMIRTMAVELGPYGIRANSIVPGFTVTDIGRDVPAEAVVATTEYFNARAPLGRSGTPADFEAIAAYLASDGSSFHTGDTITIDGGHLVHM
jgi:NAD(P)-dependent dehydrogenase (short-subunit alcohol dehydrogenase family)